MSNEQEFKNWFEKTTEHKLYPFQSRFACDPTLPELIDTGMGRQRWGCWGFLRDEDEIVSRKVGNRNDRF